MFIDARIPVQFLRPGSDPSAPRTDRALLLSGDAATGSSGPEQGWAAVLRLPRPATPAVAGHVPGCACCTTRTPQAIGLIRLFQARARGEVGFFRALVAILPEQEAADLRDALVSDPFLSGCFVQASQASCQQHFMECSGISK